MLIVQEAGGIVSDLSGKKDMLNTGGIIAGNDQLHTRLERLLKKAAKEV
jgi:myo-inositol-1(or 4)-monophosphatase